MNGRTQTVICEEGEEKTWKSAWNELKRHVVEWEKPNRSGSPKGVPLSTVLRKITDLEKDYGLK